MTSATISLDFIAGHRLEHHAGKCKRPHGHNYRVEVTCSTRLLDVQGFVVDFDVIAQALAPLLERWDHRMLLAMGDPLLDVLATFDADAVVVLSVPPTAENLAEIIAAAVYPVLMLSNSVAVTRVRVYETPTCFADWIAP